MKICDFTMPEIRYLLTECNFTDEEREVFICFSKGMTIENTADKCCMGVSTIKRIKNRIWAKIERIKGI